MTIPPPGPAVPTPGVPARAVSIPAVPTPDVPARAVSIPAVPTPARKDPPDLRLAGLAVATWLTALAGLYLSVPVMVAVAVLATIGALALAGQLLRRPPNETRWAGIGRYGWIAVTVLLGVVCGSTATAARLVVRDATPLANLVTAGASVTAELVVRDDPRAVRGTTGRPPIYLVAVGSSWVRDPAGTRVHTDARILVLASDPDWRELLPGQRVIANGRLAAPQGGDLTAAVLSVGTPPVRLGEPSWAQRAAGTLRAGLQRACAPLPDEPGDCCPDWWWGTPADSTPRSRTTSWLPG